MSIPELKTERLLLRSPQLSDAAVIADKIGNYNVSKWLSVVPYPYSTADAVEFLTMLQEDEKLVWLIELNKEVIGCIGCSGGFGYWLAQEHWGNGYMTEAGDAVVDFVFQTCGTETLFADYFEGNHASASVLGKLGFSEVHRDEKHCASQSKMMPSVSLQMTRADYYARRRFSIETDRLEIREMRMDDWSDLARVGGQFEVARNLATVASPWPEDEVKTWIRRGMFRGRPGFRGTVTLKDGTYLGMVGLGRFPNAENIVVAYFIDPAMQGKGYVTEAMVGFLKFAFDRFGFETIDGDHFVDNPASGAVMRKLGFEFFGNSTGTSRARLEPAPLLQYRLSKQNFEARHEIS